MWQKFLNFLRKLFSSKPGPGPAPIPPTPSPVPPGPPEPVPEPSPGPEPNPDVPLIYSNVVIKTDDGEELGLGYKPDPFDPNDYKFAECELIAPPEYMPKQVDHSQFHSHVVSQGSTGSCVGQSVDAAIEYIARAFWGMSTFQGSASYAYYNGRRLENKPVMSDHGTYVRLGVRGLFEWGMCQAKIWPFDPAKINITPSQAAYNDGAQREIRDYLRCENEMEVKAALAQNYPVVVGFDVYETIYSPKARTTGWIDKPSAGMPLRGGHAVCLVGFDDYKGCFKFKNSWGTGWGHEGYGYLPYGYGIRDCWCVRPKKEIDPTP